MEGTIGGNGALRKEEWERDGGERLQPQARGKEKSGGSRTTSKSTATKRKEEIDRVFFDGDQLHEHEAGQEQFAQRGEEQVAEHDDPSPQVVLHEDPQLPSPPPVPGSCTSSSFAKIPLSPASSPVRRASGPSLETMPVASTRVR